MAEHNSTEKENDFSMSFIWTVGVEALVRPQLQPTPPPAPAPPSPSADDKTPRRHTNTQHRRHCRQKRQSRRKRQKTEDKRRSLRRSRNLFSTRYSGCLCCFSHYLPFVRSTRHSPQPPPTLFLPLSPLERTSYLFVYATCKK